MAFGQQQDENAMDTTAAGTDTQSNVNVLIKAVEKTVIPRIKALVESYDPFSTRQTRTLFCNVGRIKDYVEAASPLFKSIVTLVMEQIKRVVSLLEKQCNFRAAGSFKPGVSLANYDLSRWLLGICKVFTLICWRKVKVPTLIFLFCLALCKYLQMAESAA